MNKKTLNEDDFGGAMGEMPYGMHFGSGNQLYDTFIKPFVDVAKTAAGKTAELSARAQTAAKVAFETIATTLVPVLSSDYAEIFSAEKKQLDDIKTRYADVYRATRSAFGDNDVMVASLMFAPWAFLSAAFVKKSPAAALSFVQVLGGNNPVIGRFVSQVQSRYGSSLGGGKSNYSQREDAGSDTWAFEGSVYLGCIVEADAAAKKNPPLERVLTMPKLTALLKRSELSQRMSRDGRAIVTSTLKKVLERAQTVLTATSIDEIERAVGKKIPKAAELRKLSDEERAPIEAAVLERVRASMRKVYVANLTAQAKQAMQSGLDEGHPFIRAYATAIERIKKLGPR
jgi:hypothetical protein